MAYLEIENVSKAFGSGASRHQVLRGLNLTVEKGEFVAIVGFSGSGKTTLMNLLAGLTQPDSGTIRVDGKLVREPNPERGLVFQNYSLLPWLDVRHNVQMAVRQVFRSDSKAERESRVREAVAAVNMTEALAKRPRELSGGMRQRTSVARTLAMRPQLLLLDEPLSALDALTRSVVQDQILDIWKSMHQTVVLITNDVDEGLYMADRVLALSTGPGASFGIEAVIDIERPRNRVALNHDDRFKTHRNRIISYLLAQRAEANAVAPQSLVLPDLKPIDLSKVRAQRVFGWRRSQIEGDRAASAKLEELP